MKDNRYTRAIGGIHIEGAAVDAAIARARKSTIAPQAAKRHISELKEEQIKICGNKDKQHIKPGGNCLRSHGRPLVSRRFAAAACLAVMVIAAAAFKLYGDRLWAVIPPFAGGDSFTLAVGPHILRPETKVELGEFDGSGHGFGTAPDGNVRLMCCVSFPVDCRGEGVESITYSICGESRDKGQLVFQLADDFEPLTINDAKESGDEAEGKRPGAVNVTEYTVPYDKQPRFSEFGFRENEYYNVYNVSVVMNLTAAPESLGFESAAEAENAMNSDDSLEEVYYECLRKLINERSDELLINASAQMKDGTSQTKTIQISCGEFSRFADINNPISIYGTLVE